GRRALPERVVDLGWHGGRLALADRAALIVVPGPCRANGTDGAALELVDGLDHGRPAAALIAHLHHTIVLAGSGHHPFALLGVMAAGLLNIHMFAGLASNNRSWRVPVIRCGDGECINTLVIEDLAEVFDALRHFGRLRLLLANDTQCALNPPIIHVAYI